MRDGAEMAEDKILFAVAAWSCDGTSHVSVWSTRELADKAAKAVRETRCSAELLKCDLEWVEVVPFRVDGGQDVSSSFGSDPEDFLTVAVGGDRLPGSPDGAVRRSGAPAGTGSRR